MYEQRLQLEQVTLYFSVGYSSTSNVRFLNHFSVKFLFTLNKVELKLPTLCLTQR